MKFDKLFSYSFSVFSTVAITIFSLDLVLKLINYLSEYVREDSVMTNLNSIDYLLFFKIFSIVFIISIALIIGVHAILVISDCEEEKSDKIFFILIKISTSASLIIPMIVCLTSEQFSVATSFLAFLALFSFILPKEFTNKVRDKIQN